VLAAEAVNVADVDPLPIVTPLGTVRFELLLLSATVLQPAEDPVRVTVQVLLPPGDNVVGVQLTEAGAKAVLTLIVKFADPPFRLAVIMPDWLPDGVPVVAVNVAELLFAATITDPGTVSAELVLVMVTLAPPVGAAFVSVIVQVVFAFAPTLAAAHCRDETVSGVATVTTPPVLVIAMPLPVGDAPRVLPRPMVAPLLPESVTATVATIPSLMVPAFNPAAMQIYPLGPPAQLKVLPADVNAVPAVTLRLETAAAG
jgi:hypothetical protein